MSSFLVPLFSVTISIFVHMRCINVIFRIFISHFKKCSYMTFVIKKLIPFVQKYFVHLTYSKKWSAGWLYRFQWCIWDTSHQLKSNYRKASWWHIVVLESETSKIFFKKIKIDKSFSLYFWCKIRYIQYSMALSWYVTKFFSISMMAFTYYNDIYVLLTLFYRILA